MNCHYCRAINSEGDHRCRRCGRRLETGDARISNANSYQHGAVAHAVEYARSPAAAPAETAQPVFQPSLFPGKDSPKVVSMGTYAPEVVPPPARPASSPSKPRVKKAPAGQQRFGFEPAASKPSTNRTGANGSGLQPVIFCDSPVAVPVHRAIAAAFDLAVVAVAVAAFFTIFHFRGGLIVWNKHTLPLFAGAAALIGLFYKILWALAGGETAGMRWTHLQLVDFDGRPATPKDRLLRVAAECISIVALGLGLFWALIEEESLTWHDHISKTFPTPY